MINTANTLVADPYRVILRNFLTIELVKLKSVNKVFLTVISDIILERNADRMARITDYLEQGFLYRQSPFFIHLGVKFPIREIWSYVHFTKNHTSFGRDFKAKAVECGGIESHMVNCLAKEIILRTPCCQAKPKYIYCSLNDITY